MRNNVIMVEKQELYIFNPEHDMALANFSPFYKAPQEIIRMKSDLCFLPVWYSVPKSVIKVTDMVGCDLLRMQSPVFYLVDYNEFTTDCPEMNISPWGWNPALAYMAESCGLTKGYYPSSEQLAWIRYLSSRQRCVSVLKEFHKFEGVCGEAFECNDISSIKKLVEKYNNVILKSPWSGSGRGLNKVSHETWNSNLEGWISRIVRTQGCIMAEPMYEKVCDFAMEFYSHSGSGVSFVGYSLFETDSHGNYKNNILRSDREIEESVCRYVSDGLLKQVKENLTDQLYEMIRDDYHGYLGVDMMICRCGDRYFLHPCVEINLRMNMGVVSHVIYQKLVSENSSGIFVIEHYNSDGEALASHLKFEETHPLEFDESGKIIHGYVTLTPVAAHTRYQAYLICGV